MQVLSGKKQFSRQKCLNCWVCLAVEVVNSAKFFQPPVLELRETNLGEKENIPGAPVPPQSCSSKCFQLLRGVCMRWVIPPSAGGSEFPHYCGSSLSGNIHIHVKT